MDEEYFNLWEYTDLKYYGTIEATKSPIHGFGKDTLTAIGSVKLDIKDVKWGSGGLPIFPLKIFGSLEKDVKEESNKSKSKIHLVMINRFPFGYLTNEKDKLNFQDGIFILNEKKKMPLYANERRILENMGVLGIDQELDLEYSGIKGELEAHNSTIVPKNKRKHCFSHVCIRDYFSF